MTVAVLGSAGQAGGPGRPNDGQNGFYVSALQNLDSDMPQYISDNTDDEESHQAFINAYLMSKGQRPVSLENQPVIPLSDTETPPGETITAVPVPNDPAQQRMQAIANSVLRFHHSPGARCRRRVAGDRLSRDGTGRDGAGRSGLPPRPAV